MVSPREVREKLSSVQCPYCDGYPLELAVQENKAGETSYTANCQGCACTFTIPPDTKKLIETDPTLKEKLSKTLCPWIHSQRNFCFSVRQKAVKCSLCAMSQRCFTFIFAVFLLTFLFESATLASITTDSAITPAKGQTVIRSLVRIHTKSGDKTGENHKMTVVENRNVAVYGIQDGTALFTAVPFLYKELEVNSFDGGRATREDQGLGDLKVFLKQRLWRADYPGRTDRLAILGGMEFPTGDTSEEDSLGKLPKPVQLGSGSWDPFFGMVFTHQEHLYRI